MITSLTLLAINREGFFERTDDPTSMPEYIRHIFARYPRIEAIDIDVPRQQFADGYPWEEAPPWAQYAVTDANGQQWWHQHPPVAWVEFGEWYPTHQDAQTPDEGPERIPVVETQPCQDWTNSLCRREVPALVIPHALAQYAFAIPYTANNKALFIDAWRQFDQANDNPTARALVDVFYERLFEANRLRLVRCGHCGTYVDEAETRQLQRGIGRIGDDIGPCCQHHYADDLWWA
jgi:hypothetical protein